MCSVPHSHGILLTHCDQINLSLLSFIFLKKLPKVYFVIKTVLVLSSSSLMYGPYSLISASRKIGHRDLSYAFFLHLMTLINFRSFLTQSKHLNVGHSGFHRNNFFTFLLSEILTRPVHSSLLPIVVNSIWFSVLNLQFIISLDSPAFLVCYYFSIFFFRVLKDDFICSVFADVYQPYIIVGLIIEVYISNFVYLYIA